MWEAKNKNNHIGARSGAAEIQTDGPWPAHAAWIIYFSHCVFTFQSPFMRKYIDWHSLLYLPDIGPSDFDPHHLILVNPVNLFCVGPAA
jgi:hypothetical protein